MAERVTKRNLWKRTVATVLDYAVYILAVFIYFEIFGTVEPDGTRSVENLAALPLFAGWFFYFVLAEAHYGATLGHQAMHLRIFTTGRKDIAFRQAFKRRLLDSVDFLFFGLPSFILVCNTGQHQRLGDIWAGTIVVDMKDPEQYASPYRMNN